MEIIELRTENYEGIRIARIEPGGRPVVMLTGKNGQGKSSALDSLWFALTGTAAITGRAVRETKKKTGNSGIIVGTKDRLGIVRDGANRATVTLRLRNGASKDIVVTRSLGRTGNQPALTVEGRGEKTPQDFLSDILGALTFDPLEFVRMDPEDQVAELKKLSHVTVDFAQLEKENETDAEARVIVGRERDALRGELDRIVLVDPKEKIDEQSIVAKLNQAGEINERARKLGADKQQMGFTAAQLGVDKVKKEGEIELIETEIKKLEASLKIRQQELKTLEGEHSKAEKAFRSAPEGEMVDTGALTAELLRAQQANREIEKAAEDRRRYDQLTAQVDAKSEAWKTLTYQMNTRDEKKAEAIKNAKMPVEGLTFDSQFVRYKGRALANLSGGEQLRIATLIGMAGNPKLRVICIRQGEALDEDGLKAIAAMAEEHKFQVWMTRVDSSGKVGIVFQDGMIVADNDKKQSS